MLTENELDNAELSGDELVRLHLSSGSLYDIHTLGDDIIHECKYHTLLKLAKAMHIKKLESRKEIYLQKIIKQVIRFNRLV